MKKINVLIIALISFVGLIVFSCSDGGNEPENPGNNKSELPEGGRTEPDTPIVDDVSGKDTSIVVDPIVVEPLTDYLRPVITPKKRWLHIEKDYYDGNILSGGVGTVGNDTIIEGFKGNFIGSGFFMEGDGKISWLHYNSGGFEPYTLVDMNAEFGVIFDDSEVPCYVVGRGTVVVKGKTRRALKVLVDTDSEYRYYPKFNYWIEGIGSIYKIEPVYRHIYGSYNVVYIDKCWDGDELIFDMGEFSEDLFVEEESWPVENWPEYLR